MHSLFATALVGICFIGQTLAGVLADKSNTIIPGYEIVDLPWNVQAKPGGPNMTVVGTVQQVAARLAELNPDWKADFNVDGISAASAQDAFSIIEKGNFVRVNCHGRFPEALFNAESPLNPVVEGINYLRNTPGHPGAGPGPRQCGRVSCSYYVGIFWCNDSPQAMELGSFGWIADGVKLILEQCLHLNDGYALVSGQAFSSKNWNVILRRDTIDC